MTAWPLKQTQCPTGRAVTAVQADCRGVTGSYFERKQMLQELFA